ncbi:piggyBac transposable element-derived protein 4-like [Anopheles merus]|uniref:piggyBac transposable element-derived protein 4-like n=1 Tax=Anopheles merus TaxID=30066 RepID=UPI001BE43054|nr:piggyBac transposable element-derived protein 4-like [Anopheles merus]XP_041780193.1 piggyBac transposable element-derived protein 4-like [Anopheles merus]
MAAPGPYATIELDSEDDANDTGPATRAEVILNTDGAGEHEQQSDDDDLICMWEEPQTFGIFDEPVGKNVPFDEADERTASEYAALVCDDALFGILVKGTNRHRKLWAGCMRARGLSVEPYRKVTVAEMKRYVGLLLVMGQVRKECRRYYWSTDPLLETPLFAKTMSYQRFKKISRYFHGMKLANRTYDAKPVLNHLVPKFQALYAPKQRLMVSELAIPKDAVKGQQTEPPNPAQGQPPESAKQLRLLCDSDTGYVLNVELANQELDQVALTDVSIVHPYFGRWHHVYWGNGGITVAAAETLYANQTLACGTLRNAPEGTVAPERNGPVLVMDGQGKPILSTMHDAAAMQPAAGQPQGPPPVCVADLNRHLAELERFEGFLVEEYLSNASVRWHKRTVMLLINVALLNAYILFSQADKVSRFRFNAFRLEVAREWVGADVPLEEPSDHMPMRPVVTEGRKRKFLPMIKGRKHHARN